MKKLERDSDVNLSSEIILGIQELGKKYDIEQIVLFGSRARKTNWERSDIDLDMEIKRDGVILYEKV